jgi:hypothetical protein
LLLEDHIAETVNSTQILLLKQSVICDAENNISHTTVTRRSCYTGCNSRTLSQHQPSLLLEDHVVETVKQDTNPVAETTRDLRC